MSFSATVSDQPGGWGFEQNATASMPKNIVICCDGTANEFAQGRTNVIKLSYPLQHDLSQQIVYYHPGLGTMEPAGALTPLARRVTRLLGQAIGYLLDSDVRDAYVFS